MEAVPHAAGGGSNQEQQRRIIKRAARMIWLVRGRGMMQHSGRGWQASHIMHSA
jgi:hypothetical protein